MGRHQTRNKIKITLEDPNMKQTVKHACGCVRSYEVVGPKFDPEGIQAEVSARQERPCKACRLKAKEEAKKASAATTSNANGPI